MKESKHVFRREAEVCPNCGALESFRKGPKGSQRKMPNGDRITYVSCKECGTKAIRWVIAPK